MMNSEHGKNGNGHRGLDWFRPPERNPTSSVLGLCERGVVPSNRGLGCVIWTAG
jgi:hypothetical protein